MLSEWDCRAGAGVQQLLQGATTAPLVARITGMLLQIYFICGHECALTVGFTSTVDS